MAEMLPEGENTEHNQHCWKVVTVTTDKPKVLPLCGPHLTFLLTGPSYDPLNQWHRSLQQLTRFNKHCMVRPVPLDLVEEFPKLQESSPNWACWLRITIVARAEALGSWVGYMGTWWGWVEWQWDTPISVHVTSKKINLNLELRKVWNTSAFAQ